MVFDPNRRRSLRALAEGEAEDPKLTTVEQKTLRAIEDRLKQFPSYTSVGRGSALRLDVCKRLRDKGLITLKAEQVRYYVDYPGRGQRQKSGLEWTCTLTDAGRAALATLGAKEAET